MPPQTARLEAFLDDSMSWTATSVINAALRLRHALATLSLECCRSSQTPPLLEGHSTSTVIRRSVSREMIFQEPNSSSPEFSSDTHSNRNQKFFTGRTCCRLKCLLVLTCPSAPFRFYKHADTEIIHNMQCLLVFTTLISIALAATTFTIPTTFSNDNIVYSNFYGISIEESVADQLRACTLLLIRIFRPKFIPFSWREHINNTPSNFELFFKCTIPFQETPSNKGWGELHGR